jgi:hypothetical protein
VGRCVECSTSIATLATTATPRTATLTAAAGVGVPATVSECIYDTSTTITAGNNARSRSRRRSPFGKPRAGDPWQLFPVVVGRALGVSVYFSLGQPPLQRHCC